MEFSQSEQSQMMSPFFSSISEESGDGSDDGVPGVPGDVDEKENLLPNDQSDILTYLPKFTLLI